MKITYLTPIFVFAIACGSKQGDVGASSDPAPSGAAGAIDTNPRGVPYPTSNLGTSARGIVGGQPAKTPGDVIKNYKFQGYRSADKSKGLETISLADYFDPTAKVKILHLIAVDVWCSYCNDETDDLVKAMASTSKPGDDAVDLSNVVFLQAIAEGPTPHVGATKTDIDLWIYVHHPTFTEVLDPDAQNLGVFFDASAVPWNANVDARSMEILSSDDGFEDVTATPLALKVWLDWEKSNPPAYATASPK